MAEGPDSMPSSRLYEGDLAIVMNLMEKMHGRIQDFDVKLVAILKDINSLRQVQLAYRPVARLAVTH